MNTLRNAFTERLRTYFGPRKKIVNRYFIMVYPLRDHFGSNWRLRKTPPSESKAKSAHPTTLRRSKNGRLNHREGKKIERDVSLALVSDNLSSHPENPIFLQNVLLSLFFILSKLYRHIVDQVIQQDTTEQRRNKPPVLAILLTLTANGIKPCPLAWWDLDQWNLGFVCKPNKRKKWW